jgi:hypothetical protein
MQNDKTDFVSTPNEIEFLTKYSQATDEKEKKEIEKEYDAHCKAYFDWLRKNRSKNNAQEVSQ